jgi:hypothetical protein
VIDDEKQQAKLRELAEDGVNKSKNI